MTPEEFTAEMKRVALDHLEIGEKWGRRFMILAFASLVFAAVLACTQHWLGCLVQVLMAAGNIWKSRFVRRFGIDQRGTTLERMEAALRRL